LITKLVPNKLTVIRDAGLAFSSAIDSISLNCEHLSSFSVLELGCGCGVVGLSLAQTVANVTVVMTDLPENEDIVKLNIALLKTAPGSSAVFKPLPWGSSLPKDFGLPFYDLIFAADCTYNPDSSPALVQTLVAFSEGSNTSILIAMKVRHFGEAIFFDLMKNAGFSSSGSRLYKLPMESHLEEEEVEFHLFRHTDSGGSSEGWKTQGLLRELWRALDSRQSSMEPVQEIQ
jgi:hypothetical protein